MSTETETSAGEWTVQYWWPDRCWRRVRILPAAALDWQAGAPADPDRLLAPEPSARGGYAWGDAAAAIVASLAADGPATVNQLAARLGKTRSAIAGRISRPDAVASGVRVIGRVYVPDDLLDEAARAPAPRVARKRGCGCWPFGVLPVALAGALLLLLS